MRGPARMWTLLAAISGFCGVAFGAFAAHGLTDPKMQEVMRIGSSYQLVHALAALACVALADKLPGAAKAPPAVFLIGTVLFSGSLYALALGAPHVVGVITPLGGLLFLIGWALLAWAALRPAQAA